MSTVLGRFVIPIYYVLGERIIDFLAKLRGSDEDSLEEDYDDEALVHVASNGSPTAHSEVLARDADNHS